MKYFCIVALALVAVCAADRTYKGDEGVDVDSMINNLKGVEKLLECFGDDAKCSPQEAALKKDLAPALGTACAECTPEQKRSTNQFFVSARDNFPDLFKGIQQKYDPKNKLFEALFEALKDYKK